MMTTLVPRAGLTGMAEGDVTIDEKTKVWPFMRINYLHCLVILLSVFHFTTFSQAFDTDTGLESASVSYLGGINYGYTGWSVSSGDVDGDGITDFLIGGSKVYLILGKNVGRKTGSTIEDYADASFIRENAGDDFGDAVCMTGDVNDDGYDDILIGAHRYDSATGKTYLMLGKADGWGLDMNIADVADASFVGCNTGDNSGYAVTFAGDINADGFDDILIGAYLADVGSNLTAGSVYLLLGKGDGWVTNASLADADAVFEGVSTETGIGQNIAAAGDVNADGFDDFLVGRNGKAYLVSGKASGWSGIVDLSSMDSSFLTSGIYKLASAGDVNQDGFADIIIGADSKNSGTGMVYIVFGKEAPWGRDTDLSVAADASFSGSNTNDHLGTSVACAGDVNNDGCDDILIGAAWADQYTGMGYLVYGKESGWGKDVAISSTDARFIGENTYDYAGFDLTSAGDINGDGNDDFLISAAYFGSYYTGKAYFFYSDDAVYGDLDDDRDVDAGDMARYAEDLSQLEIEKFARQFGYNNG